jgi:DNA modification methylase
MPASSPATAAKAQPFPSSGSIPPNTVLFGDCRNLLPSLPRATARMCVTSPPYYGLRDYGVAGQLGLEPTPDEYVRNMVEVFRQVRDLLTPDGTLWLNIADSYAGSGIRGTNPGGRSIKQSTNIGSFLGRTTAAIIPKHQKKKDLMGIPWMLAFALRADGWYLRQDIIWHKPNPMPESVRDRCTKAHEYLFLLSKSDRYFFNQDAIREDAKWERWGNQTVRKQQQGTAKWTGGGSKKQLQAMGKKNRRSVWTIPTKPYSGAHFATFPPRLIEPCILAGSKAGDLVLDPFMGSGTTAAVALSLGRTYMGCELNEAYRTLQEARIYGDREK